MAADKRRFQETIIVVQGSSEFPFDMMRYDRACPYAEQDSLAIARTMRDEGPGSRPAHASGPARQRIVLRAYGEPGSGVHVTHPRWRSFGWEVMWSGDQATFQSSESTFRRVS